MKNMLGLIIFILVVSVLIGVKDSIDQADQANKLQASAKSQVFSLEALSLSEDLE